MNNKIFKLSLFFLLLLSPTVVLAANTPSIFDVSPTDYSLIFLGQIFGPVGDFVTGNKTAISDLFSKFNSAVLAIGGIIVLYTVVVSTINTAHEGEVMGRRWSSIWVPVRAAFGLALLIPPKATGYSLIQVLVMWVVVQGIGAANSIWGTALDDYGKGETVYTTGLPPLTSYLKQAEDAYSSLLCSYTAKNYIETNKTYGSNVTLQPYSVDNENMQVLFPGDLVGSLKPGVTKSIVAGQCGNLDWSTIVNGLKFLAAFGSKEAATDEAIFNRAGKATAVAVANSVAPAAQQVVQNGGYSGAGGASLIPYVAGQLIKAAQASQAITNPYLAQFDKTKSGTKLAKSVIDTAKKKGWIMAGEYYYDLVKVTQTAGNKDVKLKPTVDTSSAVLKQISSSIDTNSKTLISASQPAFTQANAILKTQQETGSTTIPLKGSLGVSGKAREILKIATVGLSQVIGKFQDIFTGEKLFAGTNPIVKISTFGIQTLNIVEHSWVYGAATVFGLGFLGGVLGCIGAGINALLSWVIPIIVTIMLALLVVGATLGYYVPLIPFLLFIFGAIGWFIGVIEAMVAAPLVAIGVAHPEGQHEIYGKSEPAIYLLLNIFLRPSLMVIGLLAGMALSFVTLNLINAGFVQAFEAVVGLSRQGSGSWTGIFPPIMLMIIYMVVIVSVLQKTFSLINVIPDKVLQWIEGGAAAASHFGEEARGLEQEVAGKVGSGIGQMQSAAGEAQKGAYKLAGQAGEASGAAVKSGIQYAAGGGGEAEGEGTPPSSPEGGGDDGGGDEKKEMGKKAIMTASGVPPVDPS